MPTVDASEREPAADSAPAPNEPVEIDVTEDDPAPCAEYPLEARLEALLIGSDRPLTDARINELLDLGLGAGKSIKAAIDALNEGYDESARGFRIERLAGGWQILTRAEFGPILNRLHRDRQRSRLSQAALETLAIIAYRQPIIRAEIEAIRGVACGEVLRGLLERRLVRITGRAEELGRPMLYGTSREFLTVFGLSSVDDLPAVEGLEIGRPRPPAPEVEASDEADDAERDEAPAVEASTDDAAPASDDESGDEPRDEASS